MKQRQIIFRFLFPPRQDAAKAVHPAMGSLHNPTAGFETGLVLDRLCFFTSGTNVSRIAKCFQQVSYFARIVSFIQTHPLLFPFRRPGPFGRNTFYRCLCHFAVMAVGAINRQPHGNTGTVGQQTAFNAFFSPVRRVWAGFFPHPAGLGSWRRPSIAKTSQSLSIHHNRPGTASTVSRKRRLLPIPEIGNEPYCWNKSPFHSRRSTGSRSVIQKKSHPWLFDPAHAACRRQSDGCSDASVSAARFFPIIRLKSCIGSLFYVFSSLNPFQGIIAYENISAIQGLFG